MRFSFRASSAAVLLVAQTVLPASAYNFSDVSGSTSYSQAITSLQESGVIEGYADGSFKPEQSINRAEFLKIVLEGRAEGEVFAGSDCFPDVNDEWFAKYVCTAKDEGIVGGYPDGTFKPEQEINFVEASKIVANAFGQQMQMWSPDWYEPFVRALESSKGIPTSVATLDESITRGEMAEMIWRLSEGRTDQASKSYMNVKYPSLSVNLSSDEPQRAASCADLEAFVDEAQRGGGEMMPLMMEGDAGMPVMAPSMANDSMSKTAEAPRTGGGTGDYSQTNVQVEGVDEGDIVKTDGTYLYIVSRGLVRIVQVNPMKEVAKLDMQESGFTPSDLYVDGNRLAVLGSRWSQNQPVIMEKRMAESSMIWPGPWQEPKAETQIYDIGDRTKPVLKRKVGFEGSFVSSRRIDNNLYLVINQPPRWWGPVPLTGEDVMPVYEDSASGGTEKAVAPCSDVVIMPRVPNPGYVTVAVIPIEGTGDVEKEVILGSAENLYASQENLFLAGTEWQYNWDYRSPSSAEKTNLFRFAFTDGGVEFKAKGSVPGHILDQFSMDQHGSTFRVATTIGEQWTQDRTIPASNNLFILNLDMERAGAIEDIAPGEQIYSTRFLGDRAYMVTFKNIDPFFVIDTSDPRNPKILGKLKIPGYSDYLHPYDENHILGFGKEAVESKDSSFAWYQGMKIALFDVTDVANPKEMHKVVIGDRGTDSPLLYNHKALLFEKDRNLLAFPVTINEIPDEMKTGNDGSAYGTPVFQGALVYDFTLKNGFKELGKVSHYDADTFMKAGDYWYDRGKDIQRVVRVGESLLSISDGRVQSNALPGLGETGHVDFPEPAQDYDIQY